MSENTVPAAIHVAVVNDLNAVKAQLQSAENYILILEEAVKNLFTAPHVLGAFAVGAAFGYIMHWAF